MLISPVNPLSATAFLTAFSTSFRETFVSKISRDTSFTLVPAALRTVLVAVFVAVLTVFSAFRTTSGALLTTSFTTSAVFSAGAEVSTFLAAVFTVSFTFAAVSAIASGGLCVREGLHDPAALWLRHLGEYPAHYKGKSFT